MNEIYSFFEEYKSQLNVKVDEIFVRKFEKYAEVLIDWNKKINLTAITEPKEIAIKHFFDSLTIFNTVNIKENAKVIDVGTGAGFPGVPMKIVKEDINLTLLDSLNKRLKFLKELSSELNIEVSLVHARAEEAALKENYREKFDIAVSRAVAPLNVLVEYCLPFVKVGGDFIAMKGSQGQDELQCAQNAIKLLGGEIKKTEEFTLPDESRRTIIVINKISKTDKNYPRHGSKISKKPL